MAEPVVDSGLPLRRIVVLLCRLSHEGCGKKGAAGHGNQADGRGNENEADGLSVSAAIAAGQGDNGPAVFLRCHEVADLHDKGDGYRQKPQLGTDNGLLQVSSEERHGFSGPEINQQAAADEADAEGNLDAAGNKDAEENK